MAETAVQRDIWKATAGGPNWPDCPTCGGQLVRWPTVMDGIDNPIPAFGGPGGAGRVVGLYHSDDLSCPFAALYALKMFVDDR